MPEEKTFTQTEIEEAMAPLHALLTCSPRCNGDLLILYDLARSHFGLETLSSSRRLEMKGFFRAHFSQRFNSDACKRIIETINPF